MAEACGSRTQTVDSQLTADDDVAASARFQLESAGVRTTHFQAKNSASSSVNRFPALFWILFPGLLKCGPVLVDSRCTSRFSDVGISIWPIPVALVLVREDSLLTARESPFLPGDPTRPTVQVYPNLQKPF